MGRSGGADSSPSFASRVVSAGLAGIGDEMWFKFFTARFDAFFKSRVRSSVPSLNKVAPGRSACVGSKEQLSFFSS